MPNGIEREKKTTRKLCYLKNNAVLIILSVVFFFSFLKFMQYLK